MSTTTDDKTIEQLLSMCDGLRQEILKLQAKKHSVEAPEPEPEQAEVEQPEADDECDWFERAKQKLDESALTGQYRDDCYKKWEEAVAENRHNPSEPELQARLLHYITTVDASNQNKYIWCGRIRSVVKLFGLEATDDWTVVYTALKNEYQQKSQCKTMPLAEAKAKFMCKDGTVFTITKLRAFVTHYVESYPADLPAPVPPSLQLMVLAFLAYHGLRPQDLCVPYGKENGIPDSQGRLTHYDPETETMHLYELGKTGKKYPTRVFKVHPVVANAICNYIVVAKVMGKKYLVCRKDGSCGQTRDVNDSLHLKRDRLFTADSKYGFPRCVNPEELRRLFEGHIRYVEKVPKEERLVMMTNIGHDDHTGLTSYAQYYREMLVWAESVEVNDDHTAPDGDTA